MADTSKLVVGILPCTYHCMKKKNDNFEALAKKNILKNKIYSLNIVFILHCSLDPQNDHKNLQILNPIFSVWLIRK